MANLHVRESLFATGLEQRRIEAARAHDAIERALVLGPDLADVHAILGWIRLTLDLDWKRADASLRRALELEPMHQDALRLAGVAARVGGDFVRAEGLLRQAAEVDPLSGSPLHNLGFLFQLLGRDAEAIEAYDQALALAPNRPVTRGFRAISLLALGRHDEALAETEREPDPVFRLWARAAVSWALGRAEEADRHLAELIETFPVDGAYQIANLYGRRGDAEQSFRWLDRARVELDGGVIEARTADEFRFLHDDPRWAALMRALNFE
jgi:serine/threonine-protein kinase